MEEIRKNYTPGSMSFAAGFMGPPRDLGYLMIADYEKATQIINKLLKDNRKIDKAVMGLDGDWEINSNTIYSNGEFFSYKRYDNSCWAEPIMIVEFENGPSETYSVWKKD